MDYREKYSYSKLNTFDSCPYFFKLKYRDKWFVEQPNVAAFYGTTVHLILEREANAIKNGEEIDYDQLKSDFITYNIPKKNKFDKDGDIFGTEELSRRFPTEWYDFNTKSGKSYDLKSKEFLTRGIYDFPRFMESHPELEVFGAEIPFEFIFEGCCFHGFIDRVLKVKGEDSYIIYDVKTKDSPFKKEDLTTPLQFCVYCRALRQMLGDHISISCYYDLPTLGITQEAGTKGFEKRGMTKIAKMLGKIKDEDFHPSPSPLCWWCPCRPCGPNYVPDGFGKCPYYSMWDPVGRDVQSVKIPWEGKEKHEESLKKFFEIERQESSVTSVTKFTLDF